MNFTKVEPLHWLWVKILFQVQFGRCTLRFVATNTINSTSWLCHFSLWKCSSSGDLLNHILQNFCCEQLKWLNLTRCKINMQVGYTTSICSHGGKKSKVYALWFHYTMGVSRKHGANKSLPMLMEAITQPFGNGLGKVHSFPKLHWLCSRLNIDSNQYSQKCT